MHCREPTSLHSAFGGRMSPSRACSGSQRRERKQKEGEVRMGREKTGRAGRPSKTVCIMTLKKSNLGVREEVLATALADSNH